MTHFVWDWERVLLPIYGPIGIRWYSLMFLSGILLGQVIFLRLLRSEGVSGEKKDSLLFHIVIGTVVGARLGHCLFYAPAEYLANPLRILMMWEGGLASHGGFTGVIIALLIFSWRNKEMPFFWLTDRITIASIFAAGFIRLGNFFNSEIVGLPSDVPWAIIFAKVDAIPRHPAQLYEAAGYFLISAVLYGIYRASHRRPLEGRILGSAFVLAYGFRFFIERFKEVQVAFESTWTFNMGQWLSLPFILVGIALIAGLHLRMGFLHQGHLLTPSRGK